MLRVRDGEVEKLGVLYERHRTPLFNFFVRLTGSSPMSEDLVHDVFLRMLKYRYTFEAGNQFTSWMYQVARNAHFDCWRKRQREVSLEPEGMDGRDAVPSPDPAPDLELRQSQEVTLLQTALAGLPLESREVVRGNRPDNGLRCRRREDAGASRARRAEGEILPAYRGASMQSHETLMNCERVKALFADYLVGCLDVTAQAEVDSHLNACASCREETRSLQAMWTKLALLPEEEPGPALDARFQAMLEAYRQGMKQAERDASRRVTLRDWLARLWPREPALQFAVAVVLFAAGLLLGPLLAKYQQNHATDDGMNDRALAQLREEVVSMKQLVTLSLLQQQSASDRLRGVEWSYRVAQPDEQVLSALLRALDSDPNVNVRLAAVDALHQFGAEDTVRKGLLRSLAEQKSPLVQFELINLMVELKEKRSVPVLKELSQRQDLDPTVRERAEWGLQKLG